MARLYVGGPVEGKKPRRNPQTVSGFPRWNTYQGLGMESAAKELNRNRRDEDSDRRKGMRGVQMVGGPRALTLRGPKSHVHKKKGLDKRNLAHRANERLDRGAGLFERARVLSLQIDHEQHEGRLDAMMDEYRELLDGLKQLRCTGFIDKLVGLETARGVVRARRM